VVLLAHSWGSVLGTRYAAGHPEKVSAYVAVAPVVDKRRQDRLSHQFAMEEARRRGDRQVVEQLQAMGSMPRSVDHELALGRIVERYGGMFHRNRLSTSKLIWAALQTDEADIGDLVRFGRGNRFSLERLWPEYSQVDLRGITSFAMPVFFLVGRDDRHVPSVVAAEHFGTIQAPLKRLVWFETSAHNPPFEQPQQFVSVLTDQVLPLVRQSRPRAVSPGMGVPCDATVAQPPLARMAWCATPIQANRHGCEPR